MKLLKKIVLLISCSAFVYAGPPMMTDDPFVPDKGVFEINIASHLQKGEKTFIAAPILDANYGLIKDVQITFATAYIHYDDECTLDAFELAIKWNFYTTNNFSIAINPKYLSYPDDSIFNEGDVYELSLPMSFSLLEELHLVLSPTLIYPIEGKDHIELSSYLQYTKQEQTFYAEIFTESSEKYNTLFSLVNFGYLWQFYENTAFMFSIGREIKAEGQEKEALIAYSGFQFVF